MCILLRKFWTSCFSEARSSSWLLIWVWRVVMWDCRCLMSSFCRWCSEMASNPKSAGCDAAEGWVWPTNLW